LWLGHAGKFIKRWVPELENVPLEFIHEPWKAPPAVLKKAGVHLGVDYAVPVVSIGESKAALARANSVVLKCQIERSLRQDPYRLPSVAVKVRQRHCPYMCMQNMPCLTHL
jgi:hypothetical protein